MKRNRIRPLTTLITIASSAIAFAAEPAPKTAAAPAAAPAEPAKDEVLATVNGDPIRRSEVDAALGQMLARQGMPMSALPDVQRDRFTRSMVDDLVVEKLLTKASAGIKISDKEVDEEFAKIRKSFPGTDEELTAQIAAAGMTLATLKDNIRDRAAKQRWIEDQIKGKYEVPSDASAKEFYDKNPQHFEQPELVRASHILFRLEENATPAQITEAMKKAETATVRAKNEDFGKLAGELSEEPGAKERGGDLNFFPREGAMVEPFAEAAFKLKKDEISAEPVRTQFGYHVIKVTDRKDATKQPFDEAKEKIVEFLSREQKGKAIGDVIEGLKKAAKIEINLPEPPPVAPPTVATSPVAAPEAKPERKPIEAVTPPVSVPAQPAPEKK